MSYTLNIDALFSESKEFIGGLFAPEIKRLFFTNDSEWEYNAYFCLYKDREKRDAQIEFLRSIEQKTCWVYLSRVHLIESNSSTYCTEGLPMYQRMPYVQSKFYLEVLDGRPARANVFIDLDKAKELLTPIFTSMILGEYSEDSRTKGFLRKEYEFNSRIDALLLDIEAIEERKAQLLLEMDALEFTLESLRSKYRKERNPKGAGAKPGTNTGVDTVNYTKACELFDTGGSPTSVARKLGISRTTATKYRDMWRSAQSAMSEAVECETQKVEDSTDHTTAPDTLYKIKNSTFESELVNTEQVVAFWNNLADCDTPEEDWEWEEDEEFISDESEDDDSYGYFDPLESASCTDDYY